MPLTDSYGQGVTYPTLADKPNAQTLGQGIVEGLTQRSVMRFPSAAVRGATITKPIAGMVAWLDDVERLEVFDGNAWVSFAQGTNTWKTVGLTSGWSHGSGGVLGTFQYRVVNMFGERTIMFRGAVSRSSYPGTLPSSFTLNSSLLPADARPSVTRTIAVPCSDGNSDRITMKLDITPSGNLNVYGFTATAKPPWVGFDGCWASL